MQIDRGKNDLEILLFFYVGFLLFVLAAFRPIGIDNDSLGYERYLQRFFQDGSADLLNVEFIFWVFASISRVLLNSSVRFVLLAYALFGVSVKLLAIRRLSRFIWLSLFVYISMYFFLHEMTQMRQGVASGLLLLSLPNVVDRQNKRFLAKTFIGMLFHYVAFLSLPIWFLRGRKLNKFLYLLLPFLGMVLAFGGLASIERLAAMSGLPKIGIYIHNTRLGLLSDYNIFNRLNTGLLFVYLVLVAIHKPTWQERDTLMLKVFGLMVFSYYALSVIPTFGVRVSQHYGIVLIALLPNSTVLLKQRLFAGLLVVTLSSLIVWDQLFRQGLIKF